MGRAGNAGLFRRFYRGLLRKLRSGPERFPHFYREARRSAALQHPNILAVYEFGVHRDVPYLVLEPFEGTDLAQIVEREEREGVRDLESSARMLGHMVQVCRALGYAHRHGLFHRDLKPSNVLITHEGTVKLVDFWARRFAADSPPDLGMLVSTIAYMSPEMLRGEPVDARSDIWAVGSMIYEILAHTNTFPGADIIEVMRGIVAEEPKPISELRPDLPRELDAILSRTLKKELAERYQSMEELLADLEPLSRRMLGG